MFLNISLKKQTHTVFSMYLKTDKGSNELQKLFIFKSFKKRENVLQTELLGNRHYFGVHVENIYYTKFGLIIRCKSCTPGVPQCRQIKRALYIYVLLLFRRRGCDELPRLSSRSVGICIRYIKLVKSF